MNKRKIIGVTVGTNINPQKLSEYVEDGKSAYELAVEHGFKGTEQEWLASLRGKDGVDGKDGIDGKDGYTPVKGKDYFDGKDGKDGYTPVKGVDYFTEDDKRELLSETEEYIDDAIANIKLPEGGDLIIDVLNELPTENINKSAIYRLITICWAYYGSADIGGNMACVDGLPEKPLWSWLTWYNCACYYNVKDGEVYCYADEEVAEDYGIPIGWHNINVLYELDQLIFGGVVTNIEDTLDSDLDFILLNQEYFTYENGWIKHVGAKESSEIDIHWDGNIADRKVFSANGIDYVKVSEFVCTKEQLFGGKIYYCDNYVQYIDENIYIEEYPGVFILNYDVAVAYSAEDFMNEFNFPAGTISNGIWLSRYPEDGYYTKRLVGAPKISKIPARYLDVSGGDYSGPTKVSELENDVGFITAEEVPIKLSELENDIDFATVEEIPAKVSELENDTGFITANDIPSEYIKNTDYADEGKAGVIKTSNQFSGCFIDGNGTLKFYGLQDDEWDSRNRYGYYASNRIIKADMVDMAVKVGITKNSKSLAISEKNAAQKWLGVPTTYDELEGKPFLEYPTINIHESAGSNYIWGTLYPYDSSSGYSAGVKHVDTNTYTRSQLIGAIGIYDMSYNPGKREKIITDDNIIEETSDGLCIALSSSGDMAAIFVAYTDKYKPKAFSETLPNTGIYFTSMSDCDHPYVVSLTHGGVKHLDNKFLDIPEIARHGLAYNGTANGGVDLTADEQASAAKWLGVPNAYDNRISLSKDNASAFGVSVEIDGADASGMGWANHKAIMVSEDTYTADELIGSCLTYYRIDTNRDVTLDSSHILEETEDGLWLSIDNYEYQHVAVFVAYTTNYKPSICKTAFPKAGVYFTNCDNGYEQFYVKSVEKDGIFKKLDNKYLDLENNEDFVALQNKVPNNLEEFTEKILTDESLAVKYTAENYPVGYGDDYFGLASTDILSIDELDYYAVTIYFDHWDINEKETVTYLLSELDMSVENYGYMLSKGNAKIYIVTDSYAFADAYQIPVTSNGLYFCKHRGPYQNVDIISVDRLPIKKIDTMYLDIPKASATQYGLVKIYGELTSVSGYEGCKTRNGTLYAKSYTNEKSGQISGTCSTAEATTDKTVSNYSYELTMYGIVAIKFNNAVPANSTLNINYKGAKPMYYRGKAITSNVIKAGDVATFMYNGSQYILLSVDRWHEDINSITNSIGDIESALDELHTYAQNLIGGES